MLRLLAPAKINLGLLIGERRPDGYHDLETIFVRINLFDEIEIGIGDSGSGIRDQVRLKIEPTGVHRSSFIVHRCLRLATTRSRTSKGFHPAIQSCGSGILSAIQTGAELPTGNDNLCVRAARLFLDATGDKRRVDITLKKRIPVGAGLGGGSSDAAAVLQGMNQVLGRPLSSVVLRRLAPQLGSDVPFFLRRGACRASGRGDMLKPVKIPKLNVLLHIPDFRISTTWAYRELDKLREKRGKIVVGAKSLPRFGRHAAQVVEREQLTERAFSPMIALARLKAGDYVAASEVLHNDFEEIVFRLHPELKRIKALMLMSGADAALLSGSGSALYAVARSSRVAPVQRALQRKKIPFLSLETI